MTPATGATRAVPTPRLLGLLCLGLAAGLPACRDASSRPPGPWRFERVLEDTRYGGSGKPGWVRAGDVDADGDVDIVAGGGRALFVYENLGGGSFERRGNLDPTRSLGANGAVLLDVDADGDLDVISTRERGALGWWRNPGGALGSPWPFRRAADARGFLHDLELFDLDGDGRLRELVGSWHGSYWNSVIEIRRFDLPEPAAAGVWPARALEPGRPEGPAHGHSGLDAGDLDGDGDVDLAVANGWYEAPDWIWHPATDVYGVSNTRIRDIDGDGALDLVVAAGHHGQGVYWLEQTSEGWRRHAVSPVADDPTERHVYAPDAPPHLHHPECLGVADLDADGDPDVVTCELYFGEDPGEPGWKTRGHGLWIFENLGAGRSWRAADVAPDAHANHLLQLVDVDGDGRLDVISESAGHSVVSYYRRLPDS